jgi:predicted amidohydrolase
MRIAILQFAPKLGEVRKNMEAAEKILSETEELNESREPNVPWWLVLPEMAFSGTLTYSGLGMSKFTQLV